MRKSALTAGTALMIMTIAAGFSYGFAHAKLLVEGDANATLQNLISQTSLFRAEIFGWILILICDIMVAWSCYIFLKPINQNLSLLGGWLRLTYAMILGIAIMHLIFALLLTNGTEYSAAFSTAQLGTQVMLHLKGFESIWAVGLIIFGGHLMILGKLAIESNSIPKWIGILMIIAAIGYIIVHLCQLFFPEQEHFGKLIENVFIAPSIAGELGFGLWLLIRGGKAPAQT